MQTLTVLFRRMPKFPRSGNGNSLLLTRALLTNPLHTGALLANPLYTESRLEAKVTRLLKHHEHCATLQAHKNLQLASQCALPTEHREKLDHLNFLLKRTDGYHDDDVNCFYLLDGIDDFNPEIIAEIVKMFGLVKVGQEILEDKLLDFSYVCVRMYKDVLEMKSYKGGVVKQLETERAKQIFVHRASVTRLSKRANDFLFDVLTQRLISCCEPRDVQRFFPVYMFDLLHFGEDAKILQATHAVVQSSKEASALLFTYGKRSSESDKGLLAEMMKDMLLQSYSQHAVHQALRELSQAYSRGWNDYVLVTLAKRGIFPQNFTFSEALRLEEEQICLHFHEKESRLLNETYRNEILSKCTERGWITLSQAIQKTFGR